VIPCSETTDGNGPEATVSPSARLGEHLDVSRRVASVDRRHVPSRRPQPREDLDDGRRDAVADPLLNLASCLSVAWIMSPRALPLGSTNKTVLGVPRFSGAPQAQPFQSRPTVGEGRTESPGDAGSVQRWCRRSTACWVCCGSSVRRWLRANTPSIRQCLLRPACSNLESHLYRPYAG